MPNALVIFLKTWFKLWKLDGGRRFIFKKLVLIHGEKWLKISQ